MRAGEVFDVVVLAREAVAAQVGEGEDEGREGGGRLAAGDGLVVAGLMGQVGLLQAQVTERDEVIALKDRAISGLQTSLLGALGKQVKLLERISGLQYRHSRREAVRLAVAPDRNAWVERALGFAAAHRGAAELMAREILALRRRGG